MTANNIRVGRIIFDIGISHAILENSTVILQFTDCVVGHNKCKCTYLKRGKNALLMVSVSLTIGSSSVALLLKKKIKTK